MRRQANAALGQQQARLQPHRAVHPRVRRGRLWPDAIIQPAQNNQFRPLNAGLDRAPDHDPWVRLQRLTHLAPIQQCLKQMPVVGRGHRTAMRSLGLQLGHGGQRRLTRRLFPQLAGLRAGRRPKRQSLGQGTMPGDMIGQGHGTRRGQASQHRRQPLRPDQGFGVFLGPGPDCQIRPGRKGRAMTAQL